MKDIAASVLARLKNESRSRNIRFQQLIMLFAQEELARRISKSRFKNNLVLKGGFLLFALSNTAFRPTVDADYSLNKFSNNLENIQMMIEEIIDIKTENDFVEFEIKDYEDIAEQQKYPGIRVNLITKIKNTRTHISMDFAVGDKIIPEIQKRKINTILDDFKKVELLSYPLETIISEKLHAIVSRMELTSRMKDFYDINYLVNNYSFEAQLIKEAVINTFSYRESSLNNRTVENILRLGDDPKISRRWINFCRNIVNEELDFEKILKLIVEFLNPPLQAAVNNNEINSTWDPEKLRWFEK
ncbi:nucleotidyl transferase AbiEii/AbiGii toxin family protein [Halanaerobium kushneri]|uniref:Predicted nucleotidyltransferase component of viral defense system n=1 Tax=Halanaerobium kushneri TaxID=56779 RepID=A0A1N6ZH81_9FIRM|nr:nucleotidyl transferase AbiEii/AbiGii toxin family protein [Halanaerobium kushneri]SIR26189.1 Predicted nucleotidyltransferase component of viral defense system [Halanaerobium kushneri]